MKRKRKTPKIKTPPAKSLIREADRVFSLWIRKRDGKCVVCGSTDRLQNSHLIKRGKMSIRFSEINCATNCSSCNYRHNHFPEYYTGWFLRTYGLAQYLKLIQQSKEMKKWTFQELQELLRQYS